MGTEKEYKRNPFLDQGIVNYHQYKNYPFLVFGTLEVLKNRIKQQIAQIKYGDFYGERLVIVGERGIGKTSTLFFIKDMLEESDVRVELFSRIFEDRVHLATLLSQKQSKPGELIDNPKLKESFFELTKDPIYFLIDFPDTVETKQYKKFLQFLWDMMTDINYNKINLIFAINKSHYDKSFSYSEILGKFVMQKLDRFDEELTKKLISSRLKTVDQEINEVFTSDSIKTLFNFSKGVPRNIISACGLLYNCSDGEPISNELTEKILKEKYFDKIIGDNVQDLELKNIYEKMIDILRSDFQGTANSQEEFVEKITKATNIGKNSAMSRINELSRLGIFKLYKGGYNRLNKIISFN